MRLIGLPKGMTFELARFFESRSIRKPIAVLSLIGLLSAGLVVGQASDSLANGTCDLSGDGTSGTPYLVANAAGLAKVGVADCALSAHYRQTAKITLVAPVDPEVRNHTPIGSGAGEFTGSYDGGGFDIEGIFVNESVDAGLFGVVGTGGSLTNIVIVGGSVTGSRSGGLAGQNSGTISDSSSSASVIGKSGEGMVAGGLVGQNRSSGVVQGSSASGAVTFPVGRGSGDGFRVGGFVGLNDGIVRSSTATGDATVGVDGSDGVEVGSDPSDADSAGGFVGFNSGTIETSRAEGNARSFAELAGGFGGANMGTIRTSHATGSATTRDAESGGFVGFNGSGSSITSSSAAGNAAGDDEVGGFAGDNRGTISDSHATGNAVGVDTEVGGFVGFNRSSSITGSSASGNAAGKDEVGGFAGDNRGTISDSHATGNAVGADLEVGGFVGSNASVIERSSAGGSANGPAEIGGFAGDNAGPISDSHATGNATGTVQGVGGFVGYTDTSSSIARSSAAGSASSNKEVGGFAGDNSGTISNSHATGNVALIANAGGGFVGIQRSAGIVQDSSATGNVSDAGVLGTRGGGFVGSNGGTVQRSFATGNTIVGKEKAGGFVGDNGARGVISNSYATGDARVKSGGVDDAGGFAGDSSGALSNSYSLGQAEAPASVGGFLGKEEGTTTNSFWNTETSELLTSDAGTGRTSVEMRTSSTFGDAGWNIVEGWGIFSISAPAKIWGICSQVNDGYPFLLWQHSTNPCVSPSSPPSPPATSSGPSITMPSAAVSDVSLSSGAMPNQTLVQVRLTKTPTSLEQFFIVVRLLDLQGVLIRELRVPVEPSTSSVEIPVDKKMGQFNVVALTSNAAGATAAVSFDPQTVKQRAIRKATEKAPRRLTGKSLNRDVVFTADSAALSAQMKRTLRQAARLAKASDSRVAVTGFAAASPKGTKFEKRLAERRALRVANFLRKQGLENWIYFHGLNSRQGSDFAGQLRRVEIRVLK